QRRRATKTDARLPFDGGAEILFAAVQEVLPEFQVESHTGLTANLWLPTIEGQPLASHPLIAPAPETDQGARLVQWQVSAVELKARQSLSLLCACVGRDTLASSVLIGADLAFWARALQFA